MIKKKKYMLLIGIAGLLLLTGSLLFYQYNNRPSEEDIAFEKEMTELLNTPIQSYEDFNVFKEIDLVLDKYVGVVDTKVFTKGLEGYLFLLNNSLGNDYFNSIMSEMINTNLNSKDNPINVYTLPTKYGYFLDELHEYHLTINAPTYEASKYWYVDINYPYFLSKYKAYILPDLYDYLEVLDKEFFYTLNFETETTDYWLVLNNISLYENFIEKHPKSPYKKDIIQNNIYMYKMLFGHEDFGGVFNESNTINLALLDIYNSAINTPDFNEVLKANIRKFLVVLEKNDYSKTEEFDEFMETLIERQEKR